MIYESTPRERDLLKAVLPLVQSYARHSATSKLIYDTAGRLACVLDDWDYTPKELSDIDEEDFLDLIDSWEDEADYNDKRLIHSVFSR